MAKVKVTYAIDESVVRAARMRAARSGPSRLRGRRRGASRISRYHSLRGAHGARPYTTGHQPGRSSGRAARRQERSGGCRSSLTRTCSSQPRSRPRAYAARCSIALERSPLEIVVSPLLLMEVDRVLQRPRLDTGETGALGSSATCLGSPSSRRTHLRSPAARRGGPRRRLSRAARARRARSDPRHGRPAPPRARRHLPGRRPAHAPRPHPGRRSHRALTASLSRRSRSPPGCCSRPTRPRGCPGRG